jgi:hypothetical protein
MLRGAFRSLVRVDTSEDSAPEYLVEIVFRGEQSSHTAADPAEAYGRAVLTLVAASSPAA